MNRRSSALEPSAEHGGASCKPGPLSTSLGMPESESHQYVLLLPVLGRHRRTRFGDNRNVRRPVEKRRQLEPAELVPPMGFRGHLGDTIPATPIDNVPHPLPHRRRPAHDIIPVQQGLDAAPSLLQCHHPGRPAVTRAGAYESLRPSHPTPRRGSKSRFGLPPPPMRAAWPSRGPFAASGLDGAYPRPSRRAVGGTPAPR